MQRVRQRCRRAPGVGGDYLAVGTPMVRLVQTDPLRLRLEVPGANPSSWEVRVTVGN